MAPACCPSNAEPLLLMKGYEPTGEMVSVGSLSCYVARPQGRASSAVIMFADMFGVHTGRHKQICDDLASDGFLAICPDFLRDAPYLKSRPAFGMTMGCVCGFICGLVCKTFDKKTKTHAWDVSMRAKVVDQVIPWLREQGAYKFASVGFCWGSYGVMKCSAYLEDFKCGISFHPSTEGFCKATGEDQWELCRAIKCPQVVVASKTEPKSWKPGGQAEMVCSEALPGKVEFKYEAEVIHGYMTRGDTTKPEVLDAVKRGMQDMRKLFKDYAG